MSGTFEKWNPFSNISNMSHEDCSQPKDHTNRNNMAGGSSSNTATKDDSHIIDVEDLVRKWAWTGFEMTKTREQAKIPKEFLHMSINWKFVKFHYESPDYNITPFASATNSSKTVQPQTLFKTVFMNRTNQNQEYSFKTERSTRSSCTVAVERGFTAGAEFNLALKTPCEVLEANAGFKREIFVNNLEEDCVEEELTWGVDSQVRVPPNTETTAELVITEAQTTGAFNLRARFHGRVVVTFTNMKENNSLVTVLEGHMAEIVLREIERGLKGFRVEKNRIVVAEVRGKCHFKFGVEQRVRITEMPLQPEH